MANSVLVNLAQECHEDSQRWFPKSDTMSHHTLALCGEVGELANIVKKIERGSLDPSQASVRHAMAMEATDAFIYLLNIASILKIDLEKSYRMKRTENERRFKNA